MNGYTNINTRDTETDELEMLAFRTDFLTKQRRRLSAEERVSAIQAEKRADRRAAMREKRKSLDELFGALSFVLCIVLIISSCLCVSALCSDAMSPVSCLLAVLLQMSAAVTVMWKAGWMK